MGFFLVVVSTIIAAELFVRLSFVTCTRDLVAICRKTFAIIRSKNISDHWKEIAVFAFAMKLMRASFWLLCVILIVLSPISIAVLIGIMIGAPVMALFVSVVGFVLSIVTAGVYLSGRQFIFR